MMNMRLLLLLLVGVSFLFFGCAKKGDGTVAAPTEEPPTIDGSPSAGNASDAKELADLFQVDEGKPLEDEGLAMGTPSAKE